ncbi:MAG: pantoate--beta-alanine ligase [Bifidobacteriaceae bacterium]|jgi:pantoate--beta-alanine ligase|nr:pantoate--beta-alanine ligase [Bifidobacteriaceae bacterium]
MPEPQLIHEYAHLRNCLSQTRQRRAVVMTMGALHQGHLTLVELAAKLADQVVVTIFVNPLQFGPGEDYQIYPRTLPEDLAALADYPVSVVYAPNVADIYPNGSPQVTINPGPAGTGYEGAIRPGHFAGVLTVVHKLLARTRPDVAVFGQKDAQQLCLIKQMINDLDWPCEVAVAPIHRDADGLATSSRNRYLSPQQRQLALHLPQAIRQGQSANTAAKACQKTRQHLQAAGRDLQIDYVDAVDPSTFQAAAPQSPQALLIAAVRIGTTRLIDNGSLLAGC